MKVEVFNATVWHGGQSGMVRHGIKVGPVTHKELLLLKHMHGEEQVDEIKSAGHQEVDEREQMFCLARKYTVGGDRLSGKLLVERVFQTSLHDYEQWLQDAEELEQMAREDRHAAAQQEIAAMRQANEAKEAVVRRSVPAAQVAQ